jgi:glycogenin glucosyltransferase
LNSNDIEHLNLLSRPELGITFTKIHCWLLEQYTKCVFLDADCLVLRQIDQLFEREEFSAAPDAGWPDCFNSGVFVFQPSKDTFKKLMLFASQQNSSFDGLNILFYFILF